MRKSLSWRQPPIWLNAAGSAADFVPGGRRRDRIGISLVITIGALDCCGPRGYVLLIFDT
jgi:hypothetical protein